MNPNIPYANSNEICELNINFFLNLLLKVVLYYFNLALNCNGSYEHKLMIWSDQAIINGIKKVFPYSTILFCYTDMEKSIERFMKETFFS